MKKTTFGIPSLSKDTPPALRLLGNIIMFLAVLWAFLQPQIIELSPEVQATISRWVIIATGSFKLFIQFFGLQAEDKTGSSFPPYVNSLLLLVGLTALASGCSTSKHAQTQKQIAGYTEQAIDISNRIWVAVNSPEADLVTAITPEAWPVELREKVKASLVVVLPYLKITANCNKDNLESVFQCLVVEVRKLPEFERNECLQRITAVLAALQTVAHK